ncbi:hypothetical protein [Albibacterium profundi]|uniref:AsmA-like C-terminal domain-containing protein n=1 Tax=Albibacterium profundi TaxID=3134906 RepID=A0ABV5CHA7_9SPHI
MNKMNTHSHKRNKWRKLVIWFGIVLGVIVIALVIGGFMLQNSMPEKLKERVAKESNGVYQLNFTDMNVSLLRGAVTLENVSLLPDTAAYFHSADSSRSASLFEVDLNSLSISGVNVLKLLFKKEIQLSTITLNRPNLTLLSMRDTVDRNEVEKTLYDKMPDFLKETEIELLRVNELSFVEQKGGDTTERGGRLSGLSFALESIYIDSLRTSDTTAFWFCDDVRIDSRNVKYESADGMYIFDIASVQSSLKDGFLNISNFKLTPQYPEIEFSQRLGTEGDRYQIVVEDIKASEINFKDLELNEVLKLSTLSLEDAELRIFNNKTLPESGKIKAENFPNIAMKRLGLPTTIDTLLMKNFAVYYKEMSPKSEKAGTVFFTNLYGTLRNVTNDSSRWESDSWCRSDFKTNFMGKVPLKVNLNLNMADKDGEFNYKGSLGKGNAKLFNQFAEPLGLARIEKGVINQVTFSINANRYGSSGTVQALYDNIEISLLDKDGNVLKKKGFLSFLANSLIVKNSNPRKEGEEPISAEISHLHPQDKSFFNLMWKSIYAGLKVNLGIPDL